MPNYYQGFKRITLLFSLIATAMWSIYSFQLFSLKPDNIVDERGVHFIQWIDYHYSNKDYELKDSTGLQLSFENNPLSIDEIDLRSKIRKSTLHLGDKKTGEFTFDSFMKLTNERENSVRKALFEIKDEEIIKLYPRIKLEKFKKRYGILKDTRYKPRQYQTIDPEWFFHGKLEWPIKEILKWIGVSSIPFIVIWILWFSMLYIVMWIRSGFQK